MTEFGAPLVPALLQIDGQAWDILRVKDQDALVAQVETEEDLENFPFGLMLWASAIALAESVPQGPGRLLELGAGVGLAGLVARSKGWDVVQTDYDPRALELCRRNAKRNGVAGIDVRIGDWRDWPEDLLTGFDLVVGADVFYERTLHPTLTDLLPRFACPVVIADPLRPQSLDFLEAREADGWTAQTRGWSVTWNEDPRPVALFTLGFPRGEE